MTDRIGLGTTVEVADPATPTVFTLIGSVSDVGPPGMKVDSVDVTTMDVASGWRKKIAGLKALDKMTFKINWDPSQSTDTFLQGILSLPKLFRITMPNGVYWLFSGFMAGYTPVVPIDGKLSSTVDIEPSGSITTGSISAPANILVPSIHGANLTQGTTLTAGLGTWNNAPQSFTYQWERDGANIAGATNSTYLLASADATHKIQVAVTATNTTGSTTATSLKTDAVT